MLGFSFPACPVFIFLSGWSGKGGRDGGSYGWQGWASLCTTFAWLRLILPDRGEPGLKHGVASSSIVAVAVAAPWQGRRSRRSFGYAVIGRPR